MTKRNTFGRGGDSGEQEGSTPSGNRVKSDEISPETLDAIERAKQIIDGATTEKGREKGIQQLELIRQTLTTQVEDLTGEADKVQNTLRGLREDRNVLAQEVSDLDTLSAKLSMQSRVIAIAASLIIGVPIAYGVYKVGDGLFESTEEQLLRLDTEKKVSEAIKRKIQELGGKVDFPLELDGAIFSRKNKTIAFNERNFSVEDYFYILEGKYQEYDVVLNFPYSYPDNIVVQFGGEKTELYHPSREDLIDFLRKTYIAFKHTAEVEALKKIEAKTQELTQEEKERQQAEKDKETVTQRKGGVVEVVKSLSKNENFVLGEDFEVTFTQAGRDITLYFQSPRRLGDLKDHKEWLNDNQAIKYSLNTGALSQGLEELGLSEDSYIKISIKEPHAIEVYLKYTSGRTAYNQSNFDSRDLTSFWRDLNIELFGIQKENIEKSRKIAKKKESIRAILGRLSGNSDVQLGEDFDFVLSNGEHTITLSLSPIKGNGGILNDKDWLNESNYFTVVGKNLRSDTLDTYKLEDFTLYIYLKEPYNIDYKFYTEGGKDGSDKGYNSQDIESLKEKA